MLIGFVRLADLHTMYSSMGNRFFERNIRSALPEDEVVNRALFGAFKRIVIDGVDRPEVFAFNHNGVTLAAEKVEADAVGMMIVEPRLLNGAQTVTTFSDFREKNQDHQALKQEGGIEELRVLCKIITQAREEFVTEVTINNNRQNPVKPWNLRANDMIQLQIQDKLRDDLGIYYERQERAFEAMSDEDLDDLKINERKPVELLKLAQTFIMVDGDIDRVASMQRLFAEEKLYRSTFNESRLKGDSRKLLLCYKVQFRLRKLINSITERGPSKYGFVTKAKPLLWALMCQAILNDKDVEKRLEEFGQDMTLPADLTEYLSDLANRRCRILVSGLASTPENKAKIQDGKFSFLRTAASYKSCIENAYEKWGWAKKGLR